MVAASRRAGPEADLFPELVVPERLDETPGNRFQFDFLNVLPCSFEKPDLILAEGEDIEPLIAAEERQERLDVKIIGNRDQLGKGLGKAEGAEKIRGEEERQTIALLPPEENIARQRLRGFKEGLDLLWSQTAGQQFFLRPAQEISEPDLVLLALRAGAESRHENGNAQSLMFSHQRL